MQMTTANKTCILGIRMHKTYKHGVVGNLVYILQLLIYFVDFELKPISSLKGNHVSLKQQRLTGPMTTAR